MSWTRRQALLGVMGVGGPVCVARAAAVTPGQGRSAETAALDGIVNLHDFARVARERMTREAWEFIATGAGDELTLRWNEEAFGKLRLAQRALVDVSRLDTRVTLFGRQRPHPILLSPTASHRLVHPDAEVETARGAAAAQTTLCVSTFSDEPLERIARAARLPLWQTVYLMKDRGRSRGLLRKAEAEGCEAICVPIDSPVMGARDREHRTYRFKGRRPVSLLEHPADYWRYPTTWKDIAWFKAQTRLPLVLKGVLDSEDAERAIAAGADAVFVSNHGGRNLDTLPPTAEVLPEISRRVAGRVPVLVDGGVRRGTDVLKCLALGATAVLVGRPYLYGLAVAGARGVAAVVSLLRNELEMAMALTGRPTLKDIDRTVVLG